MNLNLLDDSRDDSLLETYSSSSYPLTNDVPADPRRSPRAASGAGSWHAGRTDAGRLRSKGPSHEIKKRQEE